MALALLQWCLHTPPLSVCVSSCSLLLYIYPSPLLSVSNSPSVTFCPSLYPSFACFLSPLVTIHKVFALTDLYKLFINARVPLIALSMREHKIMPTQLYCIHCICMTSIKCVFAQVQTHTRAINTETHVLHTFTHWCTNMYYHYFTDLKKCSIKEQKIKC